MSWVDASASAAATINPISTINASNVVNFGNGQITTPTENTISPTTSTSAVAALGSAGDDSGVGTTTTGQATEKIVIWVIGAVLASAVGGLALYHFRKHL